MYKKEQKMNSESAANVCKITSKFIFGLKDKMYICNDWEKLSRPPVSSQISLGGNGSTLSITPSSILAGIYQDLKKIYFCFVFKSIESQ